MLYLLLADPATGTLIGELLEKYGLTGLAFGVLLIIMLRQNKASQIRIEALEKQQQVQHTAHRADQKEMISDYVDLVKNNNAVVGKLTGCLTAIKATLDRMESSR